MPQSHIPSISELEAFTACAREGTTVMAARRLNLTQSAVSRSLATLEDRLGVALFNRVRRRLVLAPAGAAFLERAERLLADLSDATASAIAFGGERTVLRMAVLPSFGRSWLIPRLHRFAAEAPEVTVDLAARLTPVDFAHEPFDLSIMRARHEAAVAAEPILAEELVLVAAPALMAGRSELSPEDVLRLPLLQQSTRATLWLDWFRETGADARLILRGARFDHFDMIIDAAAVGLGVGLVPEIVAREALTSGRLVLAAPRRFRTGDDYALFLPEDTSPAPHVTAFRDWLLREIGAG